MWTQLGMARHGAKFIPTKFILYCASGQSTQVWYILL